MKANARSAADDVLFFLEAMPGGDAGTVADYEDNGAVVIHTTGDLACRLWDVWQGCALDKIDYDVADSSADSITLRVRGYL